MAGAGQVGRTWDLKRIIDNYEQRINTLEKLASQASLLLGYSQVVALVTDTSMSYNSASAVWVVMSDLTLSSVPVLAGHTYRLDLTVVHLSTVVSDVVGLKTEVNTGAWADISAISRAANSSTTIANTGNLPGTIAYYYTAVATGTVDFRASVNRAVGTGTVTASASAGTPATLQVTRLGDLTP